VLQLRDAHDNPVAKAGIAVTCCLVWASQEVGELPLLEEEGAQGVTDKHGRVSGRAGRGTHTHTHTERERERDRRRERVSVCVCV
jgi:hypothetical protein